MSDTAHTPADDAGAGAVPPDVRERAVDALTRSFASDLLSETELEARLDEVYRARTVAELDSLTANLPALRTPAGADAVEGKPGPGARLESAEVPATSAPQDIGAFLSAQERRVTGPVPRRLRLRARLGYVELDLTHAQFEPGLTEIDVRAFMGYAQIRFPEDVRVESDGHALFGFFSLKGAASAGAADAQSTVRVTGRATFGFAECLVGPGHLRP